MLFCVFMFAEIKSREEKSKVLFDFEDEIDDDPLVKQLDQVWAKDDLTYLEENAKYVQQREKEIHNIVQSISDLNTIFKELASMVTEQVKIKASIFFFDIGNSSSCCTYSNNYMKQILFSGFHY